MHYLLHINKYIEINQYINITNKLKQQTNKRYKKNINIHGSINEETIIKITKQKMDTQFLNIRINEKTRKQIAPIL
jgi:pentose-5-phosphate-3-epimerase